MASDIETPVALEPSFDSSVYEYSAHYMVGQTVKITATPEDDRVAVIIKAGNASSPNIKINPSRITGNTVLMGTRNTGTSAGATGIAIPFFLTFRGGTEGQLYKVNIVSAD